ncbi:MAG: ABC transporter permease subunit [Pseudomonadales bacterium]|nr:ABC transporter permease subunit [Pseudomonadales bacterium]
MTGPTNPQRHRPPVENLTALPRRRRLINAVTSRVVALGGAAVIGAIALIFLYLLWVVAPVFAGADVEPGEQYQLSAAYPLLIDVNETDEVGLRIAQSGQVEFFDLTDGSPRGQLDLGRSLHKVKHVFPATALYAVQDQQGNLNVLQARYPISFDGDTRTMVTRFDYLFDDQWLDVGEVQDFDAYFSDTTFSLALLEGRSLRIQQFDEAEAGFGLEFPKERRIELDHDYERVLFGPRGTWLYLIGPTGTVTLIDLPRRGPPEQLSRSRLVPENGRLLAIEPLLGRHSLLVADDQQRVTQWFAVRGAFGYAMQQVRHFTLDENVAQILPEPRRKGFATLDAQGGLHLFYSTSGRELADETLRETGVERAVIAPRSDLLLTTSSSGQVSLYHMHNEHPDISWGALWSKVWYEGYQEPVYSWQSSSADNDFEAKFSLTPLLFGTLKAAFYAMLFATPIAIMGALYTAYFMAPVMRRVIKPGIEIMAALPTVILGFLAGLWLAPLIEANLSAVITILLVLPAGIVLLSFICSRLPDRITRPFDGWYGLIIVPLLILGVAAAFALGPVLEDTFFGGDSRNWFLEVMGLDYDQRNALVVGLAMGLAVIPTIFSIAEDAIYGVPTHLINGSLALGATRWQTLIRVVVLTASPGIFSAVMIGLGRAVGETMIVLMATGNTPVMDLNIFQGMRTFAANIAVELPESEVDSSHYRILFLAALVLFMITFLFNTVAEVVRQRLRTRYGNL